MGALTDRDVDFDGTLIVAAVVGTVGATMHPADEKGFRLGNPRVD